MLQVSLPGFFEKLVPDTGRAMSRTVKIHADSIGDMLLHGAMGCMVQVFQGDNNNSFSPEKYFKHVQTKTIGVTCYHHGKYRPRTCPDLAGI